MKGHEMNRIRNGNKKFRGFEGKEILTAFNKKRNNRFRNRVKKGV